jgi:hypothetical protein
MRNLQVPVIAVFTKYDQFRRDIKIKLEDQHRDPSLLDAEVESAFNEHYLAGLAGPPPFIRLESEDFDDHQDMYCTKVLVSPAGVHKPGQDCNGLIEITANALNDGVVALMLLTVQRDHEMELSITYAIIRWVVISWDENERSIVSFQGPFRTYARASEWRRSDKAMHTSVSVALGKL